MHMPLDDRGKPLGRWEEGAELPRWRATCFYTGQATPQLMPADPSNPDAGPEIVWIPGPRFALFRQRNGNDVRRHEITDDGVAPDPDQILNDERWEAMRFMVFADNSTLIAFLNEGPRRVLFRRVATDGTLNDLDNGTLEHGGRFRDIVPFDHDGERMFLLVGRDLPRLFRIVELDDNAISFDEVPIGIPTSYTQPPDEDGDGEVTREDYYPYTVFRQWTSAVRLSSEQIGLYDSESGEFAVTTGADILQNTTIGIIDVGTDWNGFAQLESTDGTPLFIMGRNGWRWN